MPYNLKFYKTETATARCLAGTGPETSYTASAESIISQRDVDRKGLGWAQAAAQSMLQCSVVSTQAILQVTPQEAYNTSGNKGVGDYASKQYTLINIGNEALTWSLTLGAAWLTATATSGHLYVGESVVVTVGIDDSTLTAGLTYSSTLNFVNETDGTGSTQLSAEVVLNAAPVVTASYDSEAGTATLIGFSEYTTPSTPPKKYRIQTLGGFWKTCNWIDPLSTVCAGNPNDIDREVYSGTYSYDALTGATTNAQLRQYGRDALSGGPTMPCSTDPAFDSSGQPLPTFTPTYTAFAVLVTTPTSKTWTYPTTCFQPSGTFSRRNDGEVTCVLSDEDTEDDAIVRAAKTSGTSNQAYRETRGAGDFTFLFRDVDVTLDLINLHVGLSYQVTIDLNTENYGGGGSVVTQRTYNFTAAASTHQITDSVAAASGKQVTVANPAVSIVP